MNWQFFTGLFEPLTKIVDEMHTSTEEKGQLRNALAAMQHELTGKLIEYKVQIVEAQKAILVAEANGHSWLQRNWRPLTMLTMVAMVVADTMGWAENRLSDGAWLVIQIGLGGYVVGRSVEKIAPSVFNPKPGKAITERDLFL